MSQVVSSALQGSLFGGSPVDESELDEVPSLLVEDGQCMTPTWAAEALTDLFGVRDDDVIYEASAGIGAFLAAIPAHVAAFGVEIDSRLASIARKRTGRKVLVGDFRTVDLSTFPRPTALVGNPPFDLAVIDGFLDRAYDLLPMEGRIGWILPAYAFQTPKRVMRYNSRFSIAQTFLPRTIFPGLSKPITFAVFTKDVQRALVGFALYAETVAVRALPERFRQILETGRGPVWLELVTRALSELNGRATIEEIFKLVEPRAPKSNSFPRQSIRKTLLKHFCRVGEAEYAFPDAA